MNPDEAKLILQCRRAQGQDDSLPAMAEAFKALEHLPADREELDHDAAFDAVVGEKLRACPCPESLRQTILTGAKVTPRLPWWRRHSVLFSAAAAAIALGTGKALLTPAIRPTGHETAHVLPPASLADFQADTTAKVSHSRIALAKVSPNADDLEHYLANHTKGRHVPLPPGLRPLPTHGCEVFQWKGREVTLMCFESAEGGTAHLFTINADELPADLSQPLLASANGWQTISWKQDGKVMLLTAQTTPEILRKMVLPG